ncbi:MAG: RNA methyltransferase [Clostridia bacterium]|nr:RNA methyltransferase [Clostridia bacterium]
MTVKKITSRENRAVKETKKLLKKSGRNETGLFLLEGERLVFDALQKGVPLQRVFAHSKFFQQGLTGQECYEVEDKILAELSDTCSPQGVVAVVKQQTAGLEELDQSLPIVVCDCLQDPGNLGTVIRTADAAGFGGVILLGDCVDVYSPKVVRATMGALFDLPVVKVGEVSQLSDFRLVCADLKQSVSVFDFDFTAPFAVVIGNEAHGVRQEILDAAKGSLQIPMVGKSESLNAAVAFGVIAYEAFRQRNEKNSLQKKKSAVYYK